MSAFFFSVEHTFKLVTSGDGKKKYITEYKLIFIVLIKSEKIILMHKVQIDILTRVYIIHYTSVYTSVYYTLRMVFTQDIILGTFYSRKHLIL